MGVFLDTYNVLILTADEYKLVARYSDFFYMDESMLFPFILTANWSSYGDRCWLPCAPAYPARYLGLITKVAGCGRIRGRREEGPGLYVEWVPEILHTFEHCEGVCVCMFTFHLNP